MDCLYCFRARFKENDESEERVNHLAGILADNDVRQITIGGGEPEIVPSLDSALRILKQAGIYTDLHTNGLTLSKKRLTELTQLVDSVAIPIDSTNRKIQRKLRRKDYLSQFLQAAKNIKQQGMRLGIHTVATSLNIDGILQIYDFLQKNDFDYWRVYAFNPELIEGKFSSVKRFAEVQSLELAGTPEKGFTDCLFAKFLLLEERMGKHNDERVQFVERRDLREPYVFLDNSGDIRYCAWFSRKRTLIGNLLSQGFPAVQKELKRTRERGVLYDEESFIDAMNDLPIWARLWEGNYFPEELDRINETFVPLVEHLTNLYQKKVEKQEAALHT